MKLARIAVPVAALLALAGCGGDPLDEGGDDTGKGGPGETVTVGSANFPEAALLAEIYAGALEAKEIKVEKKLNIGSRETYIGAIDDGSIDLLPEYTGSLVGYFKKGGVQAKAPDEVYAELEGALPEGLIVLDKAAAEDKDAVVVTKATADKYQLKSIADLKPYAPDLVLGGPPEWRDRADGVPGLKQVYGLQFRQFKPLDVAGPLTVQALKGGDVDAANLFTTGSAIGANNFVALEDPSSLFRSENVVPLIREEKATDRVKDALNAVSAKLTTDILKDMVKRVEVDKDDAATVAKEFLTQNGLA